jgi:hypothetical protein
MKLKGTALLSGIKIAYQSILLTGTTLIQLPLCAQGGTLIETKFYLAVDH